MVIGENRSMFYPKSIPVFLLPGLLVAVCAHDTIQAITPRKNPQFLSNRITKPDTILAGAMIRMVSARSVTSSLPAIISNLQGRGFRLVIVSELLR